MTAPFQVQIHVMAGPQPHKPNATVTLDSVTLTQGQVALVDISGPLAQARLADKSIYPTDTAEMSRALIGGWH